VWARAAWAALILGVFPISVGAIGVKAVASVAALEHQLIGKSTDMREFSSPAVSEHSKDIKVLFSPQKFTNFGTVASQLPGREAAIPRADGDDKSNKLGMLVNRNCRERHVKTRRQGNATQKCGTAAVIKEFVVDPECDKAVLVGWRSYPLIFSSAMIIWGRSVCSIVLIVWRSLWACRPPTITKHQVKNAIAMSPILASQKNLVIQYGPFLF
jgi:hypothetical protein